MSDDGADGAQPGLLARVMHWRPVRAYLHYSGNRGNVLAGGVAFVGLFSLVSLLVVAVTVLGLVFGSSSGLQTDVYAQVNAAVPNLLVTPDSQGGFLDPESLLRSDVLSITGAVALVVALVSGLGWLDALREGIRAVFTEPPDRRPFLPKKARDLLVLLTLGLAVLVAGLGAAVVGAAATPILSLVDLDESPVATTGLPLVTFLVVAAIDTGVFLLLFRVLSDLRLPLRDVRQGAVVGGVALALITTLGGGLLQLVGGNNPVVTASATLGAILVWLNLLSRVTLVAAAWAATTAEDAGTVRLERRGATLPPGAVREDLDVPAGPRPRTAVAFDQRTTDRTTLAAGAVLGVVGASLVHLTAGAARAVVDGVRGRR
ncbi:YhjD/YihY/BrkB family envelope integrity protein [Pseudokineococcus basanitobsidens]|uniref:YhjD/YihY/BrkB family envelope integrity protein n=1 Tax=Pseudokineococcus basanitobsidens TaxID=1926649 RepID=A0ABU8RH86_9ACTN